MSLRVAIVGGGSAGMVCAATMLGGSYKFGTELTLITDPNTPPIKVGESMSPMLFSLLREHLRFFDLSNSCRNFDEMGFMLRAGARHRWQDNTHPGFDINYDSFAAHFDSSNFILFARKRLKELYPTYSEISDPIKNITQTEHHATAHGVSGDYTYDFIFDCRGFPTSEEFASGDYQFPEFETVNSLLVFQHHHPYTHPYTDNIIHRDGWQFGINTASRKAHGYLYNKDITSKDDALKNYMSINKNVPIDEKEVKSLSWKFYSAKKAIENRIVKMGNKLFFFEPIQGIPLHHYNIFTHIVIDYIAARHFSFDWNFRHTLDGFLDDRFYTPEEAVNEFHVKTMDRYFEIICTNYIGNHLDSDFWRITRHNAVTKLLKSQGFVDFAKDVLRYYDGQCEYPNFYIHRGIIMKQYMEGLQVDFQSLLNTIP